MRRSTPTFSGNHGLKTQASYSSNLDYDKTYHNLSKHPQRQSIDDTVGAGITAWFKSSQPFNIRISPGAKVVITYTREEELNDALEILKKYGVPECGEEVILRLEKWNPTYDEMRRFYDLKESSHYRLPPFEVRPATLGPPWFNTTVHFYAVGNGAHISVCGYRRRTKKRPKCVT